jgi:hypothetical protein
MRRARIGCSGLNYGTVRRDSGEELEWDLNTEIRVIQRLAYGKCNNALQSDARGNAIYF